MTASQTCAPMTADGVYPANFCKMLPYAGTPIEDRLRKEHRLTGTLSCPDYDFHDPRLDWYAMFVLETFRVRNFDPQGLVERLRSARFEALLAREFGLSLVKDDHERRMASLTARATSFTNTKSRVCSPLPYMIGTSPPRSLLLKIATTPASP